MKYFLGIDGGGTKTTAVVTNEQGNVLEKATHKTINFFSVGMDSARENLKHLMEKVYASLGELFFEGAFIGCSALDCEADEKTVNALCGGIINAKKIKMHSDTYIALKSLGDVSCPAVVICGTGSMAIGEDIEGNTHISGGWGHILGDEGSAYSIALNALKECCRSCDRNENTPLLEKAGDYFGVSDFRKIIDVIYSPRTSKDVIAGFARDVGILASARDGICRNIIKNEAICLGDTVKILLEKTKDCKVLGLYGGVFQNNEAFREIFSSQISQTYPQIKIRLLTLPPEEGAACLARELK